MISRVKYLTIILLAVQVMSIPYLWSLGTTDAISQGEFAIFLAINLLSFSMVAYIYRKEETGEVIGRGWILAGLIMLLTLIYSSIMLFLI